MHRLFTQIVSMMEIQFASIFRISQQYNQISVSLQSDENEFENANESRNENKNRSGNGNGSGNGSMINNIRVEIKQLERLEMQLTDTLIQVEDWLYYLRDVFSLNIMTLRRALVHHLLTEFIYPVLLEPLLKRNLWGNVPHDDFMENVPHVFDEEHASQREEASVGLLASLVYLTKVFTVKIESDG